MGVERDFLGVGVKEDHTGSGGCKDSPVRRPVPKKMSTSPQSVPFKVSQDDRLKNNLCDQFSSHGFQKATHLGSIDQRSPTMFPSQKGFSMETQGSSIRPFTLPVYSSAATNLFATTVEHSNINLSSSDARMFSSHSIPFTQANNFFRVHGSISSPNFSTTHLKTFQYQSGGRSGAPSAVVGSTNAGFAPRNSAKPVFASGQMTIFYGGEVHVYENVAVDKAQAIMIAATSKGSNMNENRNLKNQAPFIPPASKMVPAVPINLNRDQVPFLHPEPVNMNCDHHVSFAKVVTSEPINLNRNQAQNNANSPRSSFSSPVSATSHSANSNTGSSPTDDKSGQISSVSIPTNQNDQLKTVISSPPQEKTHAMHMTTAVRVPMARKASLARFLEKRKERVTNASPYSCKTPNEGIEDESSNVSGKAKVASERSMSWCLHTPKYSTGTEPLNTNLEI